MILVADSGSTKCDWLMISPNHQRETKTMGFNPFFHPETLISSELMKNEDLYKKRDRVEAIYFYGAGCSSMERKKIVTSALKNVFPQANPVVVDHDLTGAAFATCNGLPGISCILGTGSNSCFFNGDQVIEKVPALGYILGDEGSGSYFGKILLSSYLYNRLPETLEADFRESFGLAKEDIFNRVYNQPNTNVYLASFMKFVSGHKDHPFFHKMMVEGISKFVDIHVTCYDQFADYPVHFVGSIAYYFSDALEEVAKDFGFEIGRVVKRPIVPLGVLHSRGFTN